MPAMVPESESDHPGTHETVTDLSYGDAMADGDHRLVPKSSDSLTSVSQLIPP